MARPFASIAFPWRCPSCFRPVPSIRTFATTSRAHTELRPESPQYIDIPEPRQQISGRPRRIKGILPTPRDIFGKSRGNFKHASPASLKAATLEPTKIPGRAAEADAERATWKARMAEQRRKNLREGMRGLAARRHTMNTARNTQTKRRKAEERYLANKPLPEDEILTRTTVPSSMLRFQEGARLPDPDRVERLRAMRNNVKRRENRRAEDRKAALHTLYMHARKFIVSEPQLDEAIEATFMTKENPKVWGWRGSSIWEQYGPPDTMEKLMNATYAPRRGSSSGMAAREDNHYEEVMKKRLTRVAEELTGGKIEKK